MTTTIEDVLHDEYLQEHALDEEVEHRIKKVKDNVFREYYRDNKQLFRDIKTLRAESLSLHNQGFYEYSLLCSFKCMELLFRKTLIKPLVNIAYFEETVTDIIFNKIIDKNNIGNLTALILDLIREKTSIDLNTVKLPISKSTWWEEFTKFKDLRNKVAHDIYTVTEKDSTSAMKHTDYLLADVLFKLPEYKKHYEES